MGKPLNAKFLYGNDLLIAYLDLCGTEYVYSEFELEQQIERISKVINRVLESVDNIFNEKKEFLYVHMYADSVVMAERKKGEIGDCAEKFLNLMLTVQYKILIDSESLRVKKEADSSGQKPLYMPTLSRALIKKGNYYGLITAFDTKIDDLFSNFSLVGGPAIVDMDKTLQGLPMGTYIDSSIINDLKIEENRLIEVAMNGLKFVKPLPDFDRLRKTFSPDIENGPEAIEDWGKRLIESTHDNIAFKSKLEPWIDAIQGRRHIIAKRVKVNEAL